MAYFSIAMMFPIAALGSTVLMFWMSGGWAVAPPKADIFKGYIFYYMVAKTGLALFCAVLTFITMDDSKALPQSEILHEESRKLGFCT